MGGWVLDLPSHFLSLSIAKDKGGGQGGFVASEGWAKTRS